MSGSAEDVGAEEGEAAAVVVAAALLSWRTVVTAGRPNFLRCPSAWSCAGRTRAIVGSTGPRRMCCDADTSRPNDSNCVHDDELI